MWKIPCSEPLQFPSSYQPFYAILPREDILKDAPAFGDQATEIMGPVLWEFPQESQGERKKDRAWDLGTSWRSLSPWKRPHRALTCHGALQGRLEPGWWQPVMRTAPCPTAQWCISHPLSNPNLISGPWKGTWGAGSLGLCPVWLYQIHLSLPFTNAYLFHWLRMGIRA